MQTLKKHSWRRDPVGYLCLNRAICTDVESVEDHVKVASGGRHEEEEEVVVREAEQPVLVARVQEVAPVHLFASSEVFENSEYLFGLPEAFLSV